jgi:hypothetical protein
MFNKRHGYEYYVIEELVNGLKNKVKLSSNFAITGIQGTFLNYNHLLIIKMMNLKYRIYSVSSESEEFPASNLQSGSGTW